jgi:hypothetical protein
MAKPNYQYEKRQREIEKQKKKAAKANKKAADKASDNPQSEDTGASDGTPAQNSGA